MAQPVKQQKFCGARLFEAAHYLQRATQKVTGRTVELGWVFDQSGFISQTWNTKHRLSCTEDGEYIRLRVKDGKGEEHTLIKIPISGLSSEQIEDVRKAITSYFGTKFSKGTGSTRR